MVLLFLLSLSSSSAFAADRWGYEDEDGDGLILVTVPGETYTAYMLIVLDPTRVIMGCRPDRINTKGYVLSDFVSYYDGVAGINAGGFDDPDGMGDGSTPEHLIVRNGEFICGYMGVGSGFIGLDGDGILRTDFSSVSEVEAAGILEGAGFGPVLVRNGEASEESCHDSGLNPRTAIGQRSDGAILLLVIDGRQVNSLGGTYADEAEIMLRFGAVTAANLDGGSSSLLWYNGEYINNKSHSVGVRNMPSSFIVLKEGTHAPTRTFLEYFSALEGQLTENTENTEDQGNPAEPEGPEEPDASVDPTNAAEPVDPTDPSEPDESAEPAELQGDERDEVCAFAQDFLQKYVDFSADVGYNSYSNWYQLSALTVPKSALYNRLYSAFGSFGYAQTNACEILSTGIISCLSDGTGGYTVELNYSTYACGRSSDSAVEFRNLRLGLIRTDGKLYADTMTFF